LHHGAGGADGPAGLFPGRQADGVQFALNSLFFICIANPYCMSFTRVSCLVIHTPQVLRVVNTMERKSKGKKQLKCYITCNPHPGHNLAVVAGLDLVVDIHSPHTLSRHTPKVQVIYAQPPHVLDKRHAGYQNSLHPADSLLLMEVAPYLASEEGFVDRKALLWQGDVLYHHTPLGKLDELGVHRLL